MLNLLNNERTDIDNSTHIILNSVRLFNHLIHKLLCVET